MTNETNKPSIVNNRAVSARLTKRQKLNLGMGLAFLAIGIIVFVILRMMEGNIILKNGRNTSTRSIPMYTWSCWSSP